MSMRGGALSAALALCTASGALAQSPDGPTILSRASHIYKALGSFQAEFQEHLTDKAMGDADYRGIIAQSGPSHFAMRYTSPAGQALIMDGTWFWIYTPIETPTQVLQLPPPTGPTYGTNLLGFFLDNPGERYRASWLREETVDGRLSDAIQMIPNFPDADFRRVTIWIDHDASLPRRIQIEQKPSGVIRTLTFTKIRSNDRIAPEMFRFDIPKGVRIVHQL